MGVHVKLQQARVALANHPLKKTGQNRHHGFSYFELADFLPTIQKIFNDVKLCGQTSFENHIASLTIYDAEDPSSYIVFSSPTAEAKLAKGSPIQELGSMHTYMRRYLWLMAMEISENDVVDAQEPEVKPKAGSKPPAKIAGRPGGWQLSISHEVEGGIESWIATLDEALTFMLSMATNVDDVNEIFRVNRNIFDTLKGEDDVAYAKMLIKFSETKKKFLEA